MAIPVAWRRHGLLLLLALLYIDTFIGRQILAVMIEPIKEEFGVGDTAMGLVTGLAFALIYASVGLWAGRLADRMPRTRLLAICALCWGVATLLGGLATGFVVLVLARMLVAIFEAPVTATSLSLIADLYPPERRALAISCFTSAPTLAAIVAMSLGAWLVGLHGWRTAFVLVGLPAMGLALIFATLVREPERGAHDVASRLSLPLQGLRASLADLWSRPAYRLLIITSAVTTLGANAYGMWNATFLVRSHGLSLREAGMLAGFIGGGSAAIGMLFSGWLADRFSHHGPAWQLRLPQLGHLIGMLCMLLYLLWPPQTLIQLGPLPVPTAMLWCALNGFFAVWWVGPILSYLTQLVDSSIRSTALAFQTIAVTLFGVGVGPLAVGTLSDLLAPFSGTESLRYAMLICCVMPLVALLLTERVIRIVQPSADRAQRTA